MKTQLFFILATLLFLISCAGGGSESTQSDSSADNKETAAAPVDNKAAGEKIFRTYCITCHGIDGKLGLNGAKDLTVSEISMEERINQVTNGKGLMTPFKDILSEDQIKQVAEYTVSLKAN